MKHLSSVCPAMLAAVMLLCAGRAQGQPQGPPAADSAAASATYCNPRLAATLSVFLPGTGQMYAGETVKGAVLTSLFVGGVVSIATANIGLTHDSIRAGGWAAVIVTASSYLYALIDAPFAAARWNDRYRLEEPRLTALPGRTTLVNFAIAL